MGRPKKITPPEDAYALADTLTEIELFPTGEVDASGQRSGPGASTSNERIARRDQFDEEAARLLTRVLSTLSEILDDPEAARKDRIAASKLILQTQGLLEKRQTVDAGSIMQLIERLTQLTPVTIVDSQVTDATSRPLK